MIRVCEGIDILDLLKSVGWTSYQLRKHSPIGESRIQRLRCGSIPSWNELNWICKVTGRRINDLIEYVDCDNEEFKAIKPQPIIRKPKPLCLPNPPRILKKISYNGETKTITEWANDLGCSYIVLYQRMRLGWTDEEVVSTPVLRRKK